MKNCHENCKIDVLVKPVYYNISVCVYDDDMSQCDDNRTVQNKLISINNNEQFEHIS